jgi:hypothetical protein
MISGDSVQAKATRAVLLLIATTGFALGQAKPEAQTAAKADNWERSTQCAAQAERVVADRDRGSVKIGMLPADRWTNHYSPKYNRCFVSIEYYRSGASGSSVFWTFLLDAFERAELAISYATVPATDTGGVRCTIDGKRADCKGAADFIAEHMKN